MHKTLVWEILSRLSKKEMKSFGLFLRSPFYNSREDLVKAHKVFTVYRNKIEKEPPSKVIFYKKVFPQQDFDDQKLRLTLSRLHKLLVQYLITLSLHLSPFDKETLLVSAFRERKMEKNFTRSLQKINKNIDKQLLRNPAYYFQKFHLEHQGYLSFSGNARSKSFNLEKVERFLDIAYFSTKLRQACFTLSHQAVSNTAYDAVLFEEIIALVQQKNYQNEPAIALYYRFITLFQKGGIEEFSVFRQQLFEYEPYFTSAEFNDIYKLALNFCIKKINQNDKLFFQETLDMYKKGLQMKLLLEQAEISRFTYNNIVAIALYLGKLQWVKVFIETYKNYLPASYQEATYSLNLARLSFVKTEFQIALSYLQVADYEDLISHMTAKILQLKIYYELKSFESLDSLIESLRVFIQRKKRIGYHYHLWKNILKYTQKIRKVNPFEKKALIDLKEEIEKEPLLPERAWLLEKLKTL